MLCDSGERWELQARGTLPWLPRATGTGGVSILRDYALQWQLADIFLMQSTAASFTLV